MRVVGLSALLAFLSGAPSAPSQVEILQTRSYLQGENAPVSGEAWMCIALDGWLATARECQTEVARESDEAFPGIRVSVQGVPPLFMVRGIPALKPGPVPTVVFGQISFVHPGSVGLGPDEGTRLTVNPAEGGFVIELSVGEKQQELAHIRDLDLNGATALLWAGDLDHDGKLDLLIDQTAHAAETDLVLYLSSAAKDGEFVHPVALLHVINC
jgi:hypothetical protein